MLGSCVMIEQSFSLISDQCAGKAVLQMADRNIILIGFMGTGKSVTGKVLAETCGLSFADSDNEIERAEGTTIPAIFAE